MLLSLYDDVLFEVLHFLSVREMMVVCECCRDLYTRIDDIFFKNVAYRLYGDTFWSRALKRMHEHSWKCAICKLEHFQDVVRKLEGTRWENSLFYKFWKVVDG